MTFNFPIHSDLLDLPDLDEIQYDDFIGKETLNCEYKEFTFNNAGLPLDENSAEYYCYTNKFEFNPYVITNLIQYFKQYLPKYISAFINSANSSGRLEASSTPCGAKRSRSPACLVTLLIS